MMHQEQSREHSAGIEDLYSSRRPWKTLMLLYGRDRKLVCLMALFFSIKHSPAWVIPLVTSNIINIISDPAHHRVQEIWLNALVGLFAVGQNMFSHVAYYCRLSLMARNAEAALRAAICRRLQQISISYYKHKSSGTLQSKALRDVEAVDLMVRGLCDSGMSAVASLVMSLGITAYREPAFLPLFLFTIPPVCLIRHFLGERMRRSNSEFRREIEGMSSRIGNMIDMIPVARAHAVEDVEIRKIETHLGRVKDAGLKVDASNAVFGSMSWVLFSMLNLVGLVTAGWLSYTKAMPLRPGDVVLLSGYFAGISGAVLQLIGIFPSITKGFESLRSIGDVLESPDVESNRGKADVGRVGGAFRFEDVSFTYPGGDDPAIRGFSLDVREGSTVAFVGPSGSGKSTIMGLLLGYQRPTGGRILLDGNDMNGLDLRAFRQWVAVVSQETLLFQGTLRENILYGTQDVPEDVLLQVLRDANAAEFVAKLPDGLDTLLGEKGARLSGGQKQRVAIARALIRRPRVLILDEATSALDSESEHQVQEALDRLMQGRTTFIVAHRLSTIRSADQIVVLDGGTVAECGTLDGLLSRNGVFAAMYERQIGGLRVAGRARRPARGAGGRVSRTPRRSFRAI